MGSPKRLLPILSPFIKHEVNFEENIFYDESAPTEEYPIFRIPGGSHSKRRRNLEGRQNIAYEGSQDQNVAYKRIPDHHLT